jgi:hypothetical protein
MARLGAVRTVLYVVDYEQTVLAPMTDAKVDGSGEDAGVLSIDATLAGRAFRDVAVQVAAGEHGTTLWVPVVDGAERLGMLEVGFPAAVQVDDDLLDDCRDVAGLLAEMTMTRSTYGDSVERARRRTPLTVPAELQWQLLPPLTFVAPRVAVAGMLAPATQVAGDSFDYSVDGDLASIAIIDAMGHGLEATLLSAVTMAALRNGRRRGLGLADVVPVVDEAVATTFGPDRFVTGIFGELDTATGTWTWTTCGHPPALLVRHGRVVKVLDSVVGAPLGLGLLPAAAELGEERLEPGDRLLLYTDGVTEARDADGNFFGTERLVDLVVREAASGRPAAEALRRLNHALLAHQAGALQDDATTVMVEWRTDEPERAIP